MRSVCHTLLCLLAIVLFLACSDADKLTFEPLTISEKDCPDCPEVSIEIPNALGQTHLSQTINRVMEEELISLLVFDDEIEAATVSEAVQSFKNGYLELKNRYPDETAGWEAQIEGLPTFEDNDVLTIELNSFLFTGGAHGYGAKRFINFDKQKGKEIENWELFKNQDDFTHFAETKFRIQEGVPKDSPINSTGFMFEDDKFYLPENIGFTKNGLTLVYNQYEVASYADGAIELTLPFSEVKRFLAKKIAR